MIASGGASWGAFLISSRGIPKAVQKFEAALLKQLATLSRTARDYRKSFYVDAPNAHDFIFKGHVIPYRVNESKNRVEILGIFKHNIWRL